jgi:hypothetical protein
MGKIEEYAVSPMPFIAHIRAVDGDHSEVLNIQSSRYSGDSLGVGTIYSVYTANPWQGPETKLLSQTKLNLNQIDRWDVFRIERTIDGRWRDRNTF